MNFIIRAILIDHPNVWGNVPLNESLKNEASHLGLYREILAAPQETASSAGVHLYRSRVSVKFLFLHFSWCLFKPPLGLQFQLRRKLLIYFIKMSWYAVSTQSFVTFRMMIQRDHRPFNFVVTFITQNCYNE